MTCHHGSPGKLPSQQLQDDPICSMLSCTCWSPQAEPTHHHPTLDGRCCWYPPTSPLLGWHIPSLLLGGWFLTAHCCLSLENCPWTKGSHSASGGRYVLYMPSPQVSTPASLEATPHSSPTPSLHPWQRSGQGWILSKATSCLALFPTSSCFPHPLTGFSEQDFLNKSGRLETVSQALLLGNSAQDTASAFACAPLLKSVFSAPYPPGFRPHYSHILDLYPVPHWELGPSFKGRTHINPHFWEPPVPPISGALHCVAHPRPCIMDSLKTAAQSPCSERRGLVAFELYFQLK